VLLAVAGAHNDNSDTPDTAILVINSALNDDHLDNDLRRELAAAAKAYDFARLEALSDRYDKNVDNRPKFFHAFLSSRVSAPGDYSFLEDNPEMQRRARIFAGPHAQYLSLFIVMDPPFGYAILLVISRAIAYAILSRETRKVRHP